MSGNDQQTGVPLAVQLSRPYLTTDEIVAQAAAHRGGISDTRELQLRLTACSFIQHLSKHLRFPIRVSGTAMMVYHRFHLSRSIIDFNSNDVAIACLFVASKMEDTSKKARDILIAAHAVRNPNDPDISSDSPQLEEQRRRIIGLERMILETQSFDFRQQHPQSYLIKFARRLDTARETTRLAWDIVLDSYRTYLPFKATPHHIAIASLILASHFKDQVIPIPADDLFNTQKEGIESALDELLDLYMHCRGQASASSICSDSKLMELKSSIPRHEHVPMNGEVQVSSMNLTAIGDRGTCRYLLDPARLAIERT